MIWTSGEWSHKNIYYLCGNPDHKILPANSSGMLTVCRQKLRVRKKGDEASQNGENNHLQY